MSTVFISYDREDESIVQRIVTGLEAEAIEIWWDKKIPQGRDFSQVIEAKLEEAQFVLVAWSARSKRSLFVKGEALEALDQGKLRQVIIDTSRLPIPFNVVQATWLTDWSNDRCDDRWRNLVDSLRPRVDEAPQQNSDNDDSVTNRPVTGLGISKVQRFTLWFIPFLLVLLLGAGTVLGLSSVELPLRREELFLGIGLTVVGLLAILVGLLSHTLLQALDERQRYGAPT